MLVKCLSPAILALFTNLELCKRQIHTHTNLKKIRHKTVCIWEGINVVSCCQFIIALPHWCPKHASSSKFCTRQMQYFVIFDELLLLNSTRYLDESLYVCLTGYRLDIYQPSRSLRSSNDRLLRVPRWKLKSFGYRSFSYQGPVVWNSLPTDLKLSSSLSSFKSRLKTLLFKKSYSLCWDNCHGCYWPYHNDTNYIDVVRSWLPIVIIAIAVVIITIIIIMFLSYLFMMDSFIHFFMSFFFFF